jgi:hypothetical protein
VDQADGGGRHEGLQVREEEEAIINGQNGQITLLFHREKDLACGADMTAKRVNSKREQYIKERGNIEPDDDDEDEDEGRGGDDDKSERRRDALLKPGYKTLFLKYMW